MDSFKEFVEQIADSHPLTPDGWINVCIFCRSSWAESSYDEYLDIKEELDRDPAAKRNGRLLSFEHHDSDCLWVKANALVRETT